MAIHKLSRLSGAFGMVVLLIFTAAQVIGTDAALYGWFFSGGKSKGKSSTQQDDQQDGFDSTMGSRSSIPKYKFDIDAQTVLTGGIRGKQLYEKASLAQKTPNTCWVEAYVGLAANCREILRDEAKKSRLALRLTDCFLKTSGRPTLKKCPENGRIQDCVKSLDDHNHAVFLAFFIDSAAMCHYLQSQEFKLETEALVNDLKVSAHYTEHKLGSMSQQLEEQHNAILERSEHILEIQKKLQMEHALLQESIEGGMGELQEAANEAQQQLDVINKYQKVIAEQQQELAAGLQSELQDLQQKSSQLDSSMTNLHGSVEDLTEKSMAGQEEAIKGLSELQRIQIEAMQESRHSVKSLVEQAQQHQSEFRGWQSELDKMHHRLVDGTTHMIKAQETFVTKQAAIFSTMEKLFSLHNSILVESRAVKTLMLYFALSIFVYMATTTKQTQSARVLLYFGLFLTLTFEIWLIRFRMEQMNHNTMRLSWPPKQIVWLRYSFGGMALAYLLYTYLTFKDYDYLNYRMLKDIHGRFGKQSRLQEQLLQEYLARCEICKDLPQPNGHSSAGHKTPTREDSFKDHQNSHESFEENRVRSTSRRTKKTESSTSRPSKESARELTLASSPAPRPTRKRASGLAHTTGSKH